MGKCIEQDEEYDPALNSVITLNTDAALTAARAADQAVTDGTVLGRSWRPFGLKDIIDAAHFPQQPTLGSTLTILQKRVPRLLNI
ncbi:MAG: hypothetical protein CM1200mP41_37340 [Gammaproteobacteria bacterium]|nr:MAG: hypothetical protein CM1200mP41_37340 [Gammaproteobacteria bacterium]